MLATRQRALICVLAAAWAAGSAPARGFEDVFDVEVSKAEVATVAGSEHAEAPPAGSMLYLRDGDYFNGAIEDCDVPNVVRWRVPGIAAPLEFSVEPFRAAYFAASNEHPAPAGDYCFELTDGDLLYGSLVAVTPEGLEIDAAPFGRLHVARSAIRRFTSWAGNSATEYRGPNGLAEWRQSGNDKWREEAGRLIATAAGAEVQKELPISAQARFEFEISWSSIPEFTFVLATGASDEQLQEGYRFEVWDRTLVVVRACGQSADVATICQLNTFTDRMHLEAFYNQASGRLSIHALDGTQLAEITVAEKSDQPQPLRLVSLTNRGADVRLEFLAVGPWNGQLPTPVEADKQRIRLVDGTILYGEIIGYHSDTKQFVLPADVNENTDPQGPALEKLIDATQVSCISLSPTVASDKSLFRVGLQDGSRFSGKLTNVVDGKIYLARPGIEEPLACPIADVRSLVGLAQDDRQPDAKHRIGRLEMEGVRSHGWLAESMAESVPKENSSCLVWQPRAATSASPLTFSASGRIVYRDPPQPAKPSVENEQVRRQRLQQRQVVQQQRGAQRPGGVAGAVLRVMLGDDESTQPRKRPKANGTGKLYLIGGDCIPGEITNIDDEGVHFVSTVVEADTVPHSQVKALELMSDWTAAALAEEKRQRLLTLPRMQKPNPPTHLIASTTGDFLRANLTSLTAETLTIESHLDSKRIPRNRIACIIWLRENEETKPPISSPDPVSNALNVQAVRRDGVRLTFVPQACTGELLTGTSALLGACRHDLNAVDMLIFGSAINSDSEEQLFQSWKLVDAPEPRYIRDAQAGGTGERPGGTESGLVGKAAPDFNLDLVDGGHFSLADQKGHIVVLDFWASWCGPCMQAMPTVDAVVEEFAGDKVKLIAVNLQEDRVAASSALERLKIHPKVALDIDGAAAEKYQVTAIPQTVVIDAEGRVAHVFVGANSDFAAQLRAAIQNLLTPPAP